MSDEASAEGERPGCPVCDTHFYANTYRAALAAAEARGYARGLEAAIRECEAEDARDTGWGSSGAAGRAANRIERLISADADKGAT